MNEFFIALVLTWSVVDGDTIDTTSRVYPEQVAESRVRFVRVDTPELHKGPPCEREMAKKAMAYTAAKLQAAKVIVVKVRITPNPRDMRDSFGRVLGDVVLDGRSLSDDLLAAGIGRPYGTKVAWC